MKIEKSLVFAFVIVFLITNSVLVSALTGSMGNSRMILYPEVNGWTNTVIEKTILTKNLNNVSINITLALDQNATKFIELVDETYILEPGEERKAEFLVKVKKEGRYEGKINVFFAPIEGKEPGVVLSSTVIVIAKKDQGYEDDPSNPDPDTNTTIEDNGEITPDNNKPVISNLVKFWGTSTLILLIVLLVLLYIWGKKRNQSKKRKNKSR
jgi:hypothetical protein